MKRNSGSSDKVKKKGPGLFSLLTPYRGMIGLLILFALLSNGINLVIPKIIANGIDAYPKHYELKTILTEFLLATGIIFVFTYLQNIVQTYTSHYHFNIFM